MRIFISGSHGFIGSSLLLRLTSQGHQVSPLARGVYEPATLEGCDAVIHLAGENIAAGRWSRKKKSAIKESRVQSTALLCHALATMAQPPPTFLCASAVGYYGDRGDEVLTETSPAGTGFLAEVCRAWEGAADPARKRGVRVAHLRFGMVLSPQGGALAKLLPPFRLGLGGPVGRGRQYWSWIALEDVVGAIAHLLRAEAVRGPVNLVSPQPVTNAEFTRALGRALHRPTVCPLPAFAARLLLGEMAEALLLASARVEPAVLLASGYTFRFPNLDGALAGL